MPIIEAALEREEQQALSAELTPVDARIRERQSFLQVAHAQRAASDYLRPRPPRDPANAEDDMTPGYVRTAASLALQNINDEQTRVQVMEAAASVRLGELFQRLDSDAYHDMVTVRSVWRPELWLAVFVLLFSATILPSTLVESSSCTPMVCDMDTTCEFVRIIPASVSTKNPLP